MLKLECNSQDAILDHLEASPDIEVIRKNYQQLIVQGKFEKQLKAISRLAKSKWASCFIDSLCGNDEETFFIKSLKQHLKLAAIEVTKDEHSADKIFLVLSNKPPRKLSQDASQNNLPGRKNRILLLLGKNATLVLPQQLRTIPTIDMRPKKEYYKNFFTILQKLLPEIDLTQFIQEFEQQYHSVYQSVEEKISQTPSANEGSSPVVSHNIQRQLSSGIAGGVIGLTIVGSLLLVLSWSTIKTIFSDISNNTTSVRADFPSPHEDVLLKRRQLLQHIDKKLDGQKDIQVLALLGIGGAGKTTLAHQYAHKQKMGVIWEINAETHETLQTSFETLAQALASTVEDQKILRNLRSIQNPIEKEEQVLQFVKKHLRLVSNWLLVYDNVERFSDIKRHFPNDPVTWGQGRVILTTRNNHIQHNQHVDSTISVGELNAGEKLTLFKKIMTQNHEHHFTANQIEKIKQFLKKLPSFPLDVSTAAYYIKATNLPYATYLGQVGKNNKEFVEVQQNLIKESGYYTKTRYGIMTLSLQNIIKNNQDFADLLLFISLIDSQNIPRDVLNKFKNEETVTNFLYNLKKYSLIRDQSNAALHPISSFSIHRSTQTISLAYLIQKLGWETSNKVIQNIARTLEVLIEQIVKREDSAKMMNTMGHYEKFLSRKSLLNDDIRASLNAKLGFMYYILGNYKKAQQHLESSLSILSGHKRKRISLIVWTLTHLGQTYRSLGYTEKAKDILVECQRLYERYFPENQTGLARTFVYLGNAWRDLGHYKKALLFIEKGVQIYQAAPLKSQIELAEALTYLGQAHWFSGKPEKAKNLFEKGLEIFKHRLTQNHYRAAWSYCHLGNVYVELGNYVKAKSLLEKSLHIFRSVNYKDNDDVIFTLEKLAIVYKKLGQNRKAEKLHEENFSLCRYYCPKSISRFAQGAINSRDIEGQGNQYNNAEIILRDNLRIYERTYGKEHICFARNLWNLAQVSMIRGQLKNAKRFFVEAREIFEKNAHPDVCLCLEELAELYLIKTRDAKNQGHTEQEKLFKKRTLSYLDQALKVAEKQFPENSTHIKRIQFLKIKLKRLSGQV